MTESELPGYKNELPLSVRVFGSDYCYDGFIVSIFRKKQGAWRCVVEDSNGRLFIHNAKQVQRA